MSGLVVVFEASHGSRRAVQNDHDLGRSQLSSYHENRAPTLLLSRWRRDTATEPSDGKDHKKDSRCACGKQKNLRIDFTRTFRISPRLISRNSPQWQHKKRSDVEKHEVLPDQLY